MKEHAPEQANIVAGKVAAYSGAATAITSGLTITEWGVIVGIVVGVLGLVFGQYWSWRKESREARALAAEEARELQAQADKIAANKRREEREIAAHAAYLRRIARNSAETAPAPLDMCANDAAEQERSA